jgi:histidine ammonia-lyase
MCTPGRAWTKHRAVIEALVAEGAVVYGVTTGFGDLATTFVEPGRSAELQEHLLMSHAAGVGEPFPREVVRAMLLLRANTLALGHSGCRLSSSIACLPSSSAASTQSFPRRGASARRATLAPLAHLALPLIGRGQVELGGQVLPALLALREAGVEPLRLEAKEGLALLNGTQMMGAIGALLLADADRLVRTASVVAAMSVEALLGTDVAYAAAYQLARPHPGQGGGRRGVASTSCASRRCRRATTHQSTRSRTRTRCVACPRSRGGA